MPVLFFLPDVLVGSWTYILTLIGIIMWVLFLPAQIKTICEGWSWLYNLFK